VTEHCWRDDDCELSNAIRLGLERVAVHTQRHSEMSELRVSRLVVSIYIHTLEPRVQASALLDTTLESLKVCAVPLIIL
jgi:hypothetical protein